jgi:hypothetical protein
MTERLVIFIAGQFIAFFVALAKIYSDQQAKNREFELEIRSLKSTEDEMNRKMDRLLSEIIEIKLTLKDKQNR